MMSAHTTHSASATVLPDSAESSRAPHASLPLVSILIPCYNAERWVGEAIRSALDQTYRNTEVIVVDDGSTDRSVDVIRSFGPAIWWESGPNCGANAARNRLLELSRGEWLQYLDADDVLDPTKIEAQVGLLSGSPDTVLVAGGVRFETGEVAEAGAPRDPWMALITRSLGRTTGMLWRRSAIQSAGAWRVTQPCCQEYVMAFDVLKRGGTVVYDPEPRCVLGCGNPGSVSRRNLARTMCERVENIREIVGWLRSRGELTEARRRAACVAVVNAAQILSEHDRRGGRAVLAQGRDIDPAFAACIRREWPLYGAVFTMLGFRVAETYAAGSQRLKRFLRAGRRK